MKKIKILFIFILIIISICSFSHAYQSNTCVSNQNNIFEAFLEIVNLAMIIINFCFVVYVFKTEQNKKAEEETMQYDQYWYKKFIIDDNIVLLDKFFLELDLLIDDVVKIIKENNDIGEEKNSIRTSSQVVFEKWTNMHNSYKTRYCEKIDIVMPNLAKDSRRRFSKLQDCVTASINKILLTADNKELISIETELRTKITDFKKELIKKLYTAGKPN